ncbi:MAG: argininosuccinate lyase [Bacteroidota bacterium]
MPIQAGRFRKNLHPAALKFSSSLHFDKRLYAEDIHGSISHITMLKRQNIVTSAEAKKITIALNGILREIQSGKFSFHIASGKKERFTSEDVHMAIEKRLIEKVGIIGGKLHTARSRNDQIALDGRLYLQKTAHLLMRRLVSLQKVLLNRAEKYSSVIMPGYTHMQRAQPILLGHHLLAYVSMFERDKERLADCQKRIEQSPLGAAALGGTSFPIDRNASARMLGFSGIIENSIDAVSDRDVLIEFISHCSIIMMHLSRLCEELVLWSTKEWNFIEIRDEFTTGSSIMPQKKNPDIAELIRGKTGRVYGDLMAILTIMKGLPLAYNRDMQEDKEPLFDAADTTVSSLEMCAMMLKAVSFNAGRFETELNSDFLLATEAADYLVRKGMPFRKAHTVVGAMVRECASRKIGLNGLSLKEFKKYSTLFEKDTFDVLDARKSIALKKSAGSTSPKEFSKALKYWTKKL